MYKIINFYGRLYKIYDNGVLIRCAYTDTRLQCYGGKTITLNRFNKEIQLKHCMDSDGYYNVALHGNGHHRRFKLHHLMYIVYKLNITDIDDSTNYIGYNFKTKQYNQINHRDGNKLNNHPDNLELCSLQHNIKEACRLGIHNSQTKAVYVLVYYYNQLIFVGYKLRSVCDFIKDEFNLHLNSGTLSYCARHSILWHKCFRFEYINQFNDYPEMEYKSKDLEAKANLKKLRLKI